MRTTPARNVVSTIATACACLLLTFLLVIQMRYVGTTTGLLPTTRVNPTSIEAPRPSADGTIVADYCSEAVTTSGFENLSGRTSTVLSFDDAWFAHDARVYQHDLATACAVLTAVCNSESQYYSNVEGALPYAEQALTALGFDDVRTESYALRSNILDELGALLAGTHDVAAYTFASKTVADAGKSGAATLVFVGIRGSYGVEWLSNFNLAEAASGSADHRGFRAAEDEVERALAAYVRDIGADPSRTRILITGHSRGGAIANLLAARLDDLSGTADALAPASGVFAYTFAAPGATREAGRQDAAYSNIFNIVNETDIVPQLPLSIWGYGRYGTTVTLPSVTSAGFDDSFDTMQAAFERNTGVALACDEDSLAALDAFEEKVARTLPSADALASPSGIVGAVQALFGLDIGAALASHYPDTYIAWMQSTESSHLSFTK